jgi:hypothetical protein
MKPNVYTNQEYNSADGMLTSVWGPSLWHFLHTLSFNYPINPTTKNKKDYKIFILSLRNILPCKYCRENLEKNLKDTHFNDSSLKNRESFSKFIYNLHNHINKMLGKKQYKPYEQVRDEYENFRSRCKVNKEIKHKGGGSTKKTKNNKKEKGCVHSLYGVKSKCIVRIVPNKSKKKTFQIDKKCIAYRL